MKTVDISIVIPVYSGKNYLDELVSRIETIRNNWENVNSLLRLIEAIFVNDASADGSLEALYNIQKKKPWVKVINLSRNFGQHSATVAGILHTSGDWIVTLDEDLQHDPRYIDKLLETAVESGCDIVYANPDQAVHESVFRDWTSRSFKWFVSFVTGSRHIRSFNSFRLIRGSVARAAGSVCTHGTYFDIALCWFTENIRSLRIPMKDIRFLRSGASGYTVRKLFSHARRMIVSSEAKVIRFGAAIGFLAMLLAFVLGIKILLIKFIDPEAIQIEGWASLFLTILFFGGLISVLVGIALEYISVVLLHIQGKPTFFVIDRLSDSAVAEYYQGLRADANFRENRSI
ncbi:MAG: glycosyltransferase family 2 protein [Desulfobulbaceae bacterium]